MTALDNEVSAVVADLHRQINELSPPAKLRLAAELLENQKPKMAHAIAERVVLELGAAMLLAKPVPK